MTDYLENLAKESQRDMFKKVEVYIDGETYTGVMEGTTPQSIRITSGNLFGDTVFANKYAYNYVDD